jgi:sulfur-oxidizing protein SoxZ
MARPLVNIPRKVKRGAQFDIRILISHPMESGQRRDEYGKQIPRDIIHSFLCTYAGEEVFRADFFPAIAANPFLTFSARAVESGQLVFTWTDDHGVSTFDTVELVVE